MDLARQLLSAALNFALPRRCGGCGIILGESGDFCGTCWSGLNMLPGKGCLLCTTPVDLPGTICGPCLETPPRHDGVLAAVEYGEVARTLALKLKYGRKPGVASVMASAMMRHAAAYPGAVLIPVPLHRWRLWQRGFNQSLLICRQMSRQTGQEVVDQALVRIRKTSPLGGLSRSARAKEVGGAFACPEPMRRQIDARDVLLVDDVYTTGATANACAAVLKRAGARSVRVLAWARVLKHEQRVDNQGPATQFTG